MILKFSKFGYLILFSLIVASCTSTGQLEIIETIPGDVQGQEGAIIFTMTPIPTMVIEDEVEVTLDEPLPVSTEVMPTEQIDAELSKPELDPSQWQDWPVLPVVTQEMSKVYAKGIRLGTNPRAFSIFGDCQSLPDVYMGGYETGDYELPLDLTSLQSTIEWYEGSFNRESVTIKKGTTTAAILWEGWVDEEDSQCEYGESPLDCELRIHNPSVVLINLGTHWEVRNGTYLRKILEELTNKGIVPIISTKADTREGDAWINQELIQIADEFNAPVWNFWQAVQELENQGMLPDDTMYLSDKGLEIRRLSSLQALDAVLQQLTTD